MWEEVACQISERHGTTRTRDDISEKWYNVLTEYKARIADKLASIKRTGGGPAEESLDELEAKIYSIKGKEAFEGIESGIDLIQEQLSTGIYNEQTSQEGEKLSLNNRKCYEKGNIRRKLRQVTTNLLSSLC